MARQALPLPPPIILDPIPSLPARGAEAGGAIVGEVGNVLKRIAIGALGTVLIALGLLMIGTEASLTQAAARLGRELKGVVRG